MQYSGYQSVQHHQAMRPPSQHPAPPQLSIPGQPPIAFTPYTMSPSPATGGHIRHSQLVPQSPSEESERAVPDEDFFGMPGPPAVSHKWKDHVWALQVVQNPQRARMCGFGDKDRRPISPPPCIRLIIIDLSTMEEVDYNEVELSHLVLTVDIWDLQADREMNLVRQSNASPCISSAATGAYPIATTGPPATHTAPEVFSDDALRYSHQRNMPVTNQGGSAYQAPSSTPNYQARQTYVNGQVNGQNSYAPPPPPPAPYQNGSSPYVVAPYQQYPDSRYQSQPAPPAALPRPSYGNQLPPIGAVVTGSVPPQPNPIPTAMEQTYVHTPPTNTQLYTRNLIGSLCASAFRLKDENDKVGIWFVLQDLSVRTEGWFRLKANFFNISDAVQKQMADASNGTPPNKAKVTAPCLANVFTSPFRVYSAKKFPGVVESTLLSKAFANQGIKIPIRKDTGSKRHREDSDDEGSGGED